MQIPFLGPTYQSRSPRVAMDRSINWYPELNMADSKSVIGMIGTPGTYLFSHVTGSPVRGMRTFNGVLYAVAGNTLVSVNSSGQVSATLGTLDTALGRVSMSDNGVASSGVGGNQLMIVDGVDGYIFNILTSVFTKISDVDSDFPSVPSVVTYLDGYFIVVNGTMSYWVSDLYDGLAWNALATSPVSGTQDAINAVAMLHQQLCFIKEYSTEFWYDAATPTSQGSPFSRISGGVINYGTKAPYSVAQGANSLFFLAWERNNDGGEFIGVVQMNGYTPVLISPVAINYRIAQLDGAADGHTDAFGYCYSDEGHTFYVLTFPTGDWTIVYDVTTNMWHERSTSRLALPDGYTFALDEGITFPPTAPIESVLTTVAYSVYRHVSNCYAFAYGKHLVGDWDSGDIFEMSSAYFEDNGEPIHSVRVAQHIHDKQALGNVMIHKLQIDAETGIGEVTEELREGVIYADGSYLADGSAIGGMVVVAVGTSDPQAILSWSDDGGYTWSGDHRRSMGAVGAYKTRLIWRRLGYSRDRVFRLTMTNVLKRNIVGAYLEMTG